MKSSGHGNCTVSVHLSSTPCNRHWKVTRVPILLCSTSSAWRLIFFFNYFFHLQGCVLQLLVWFPHFKEFVPKCSHDMSTRPMLTIAHVWYIQQPLHHARGWLWAALASDSLGNCVGWHTAAVFAPGLPDLHPTNHSSAKHFKVFWCQISQRSFGVCTYLFCTKQLDILKVEGKTIPYHYLSFTTCDFGQWHITTTVHRTHVSIFHPLETRWFIFVCIHPSKTNKNSTNPWQLRSHHVLISVSANTALLAERKGEKSGILSPLCSVNSLVSSQPSQKHIPHCIWQILTRYWLQLYSHDSK